MSELLDDLPTAHLEYPLRDGAVGDWLVLGPLLSPLTDPKTVLSDSARLQALQTYFPDADEVVQTPAERAPASATVATGMMANGVWRVVNSYEDGWVDLAQRIATPHALCAWLYAQCVLQNQVSASLHLTTASPTQIWINGELVFSYEELPSQPAHLTFVASLDEGANEILIRVANVGLGDVQLMVGLQIPGATGVVALPTLLEPVARRQRLSSVMASAYLAQEVYSNSQHIVLRWPAEFAMVDALTARLQTPAGRIFGEANPMVQKGTKVDFGEATQFPDGLYEVLLQPQFEEYYVQDMRVQRRIPLQICNGKWSLVYYGSYGERRQEALQDAARRPGTIFAEIAKSALGQWETLRHDVVEQSLTQLSPTLFGFEATLLALLGWVARMGDLPDFPQEVTWALEESAPLLMSHLDDNPDILLVTCHLLAGQLYSQRSFADLNTGEWHQARAEERLMRWLRATAQLGLPNGESRQGYADALVALSHLVDLAHSDEVAELAMVTMDKLAYQMALQCFLGVWGGSQDANDSEPVPSARLGGLSGVARLWWGQGAFCADSAATVALACAESYTLPEIIAAIGLDRRQDVWLQRHDVRTAGTAFALDGSMESSIPHIQRAAFRTGDYLLASAQGDWAEQASALLWQVSLGPDTLIYGNRPACSSSHPAWQCNYWRGNDSPVRVAQWHDVLVAGYGRAEAAHLDFSHAYFPLAHFDEIHLGQGWAMARKGNGYVALTATGGVEIVSNGRTAQRELRAAAEAIWLVQMGRAAEDGSFADFVSKVLAQPLILETAKMDYLSLRGRRLQFSLDAPLAEAFRVDESAQPIDDFPHMESIYGGAANLPSTSVEIIYQEHKLRLDLGIREMPSTAL